jgi:RNA polymerase sigma-70 factor (ECF subfamily)
MVYNEELVAQETAPAEVEASRSDAEAGSKALAEALRRLSGLHREVLILRFYENMKIHEIAAHLGISKGTVKSRLHYALAEMQRLVPDELNLFGVRGTEQTDKL